MLIAGVVVAKLVIVTTLLVGGSLTQTAAAGGSGAGLVKGMLTGVGLMGLAAFAGWWTVSWFGLARRRRAGPGGRHDPRASGSGTFPGGGRGRHRRHQTIGPTSVRRAHRPAARGRRASWRWTPRPGSPTPRRRRAS